MNKSDDVKEIVYRLDDFEDSISNLIGTLEHIGFSNDNKDMVKLSNILDDMMYEVSKVTNEVINQFEKN